MSGGFGGLFGDVFGTGVVTSTGGVQAIKNAIGQQQNHFSFIASLTSHYDNDCTPAGPIAWTWKYNTVVEPDMSVAESEFSDPTKPTLVKRVAGPLASYAPDGGGNSSQDSAMTTDAQALQRVTVAQGKPQVIRCFYEWDAYWMAWSGLTDPAGLVTAMRQVEKVYHRYCPTLQIDLCGGLGCGDGFFAGGSAFAHGHSLWDQVYGVLGGTAHGGIVDIFDFDAYSNGPPLTPISGGANWLVEELEMIKQRAITYGMQIAHGEWGIGATVNVDQGPGTGSPHPSAGPHNYAPDVWAITFMNWWASLPASGPGSLAHFEIFDIGGDGIFLDGRGGVLIPTNGPVFGSAIKLRLNTTTTVTNVNGTGRLDGGGTLVATGHENVILISDHPEVDHTGATDCSDEWQAIINAAPQGSIIRGDPTHTYLFNISTLNDSGATVVLDATRNFIQIDGNGCTFKQTVSGPYTTTKTDSTSLAIVKRRNLHRAFFSLLGADHCKIYNATFIGANPNSNAVDAAYNSLYESQHIFNLEGSDDFEAYGFTAHHNWGDLCAMQPDVGSGVSCSNVSLHDYTYHDNGRQHLTLNGVNGLLVQNANAYNIRHAQVDLEPNFTSRALKPVIKNCVFRNVTFGFMRLNLFSAGNTQAADVDGVTFDSCSFFQWKMPDVEGPWTGTRRKNLFITNNTVLAANPFGGPPLAGTKLDPNTGFGVTSQHGVSLGVQQWDGVNVTGNIIYLQNRSPTMVAVWCLDCTGINVHGNTITGTPYELETDVTPGAGTVGSGLLDGGGTLQATGFPTLLATSAILIGGGSLAAAGTVGVVGTGTLDGGGSLDATGLAFDIVDVAGTGLLDGGGDLQAVGIVLELGAGLLDGGGDLVGAGIVGQVDAVGLLDGGGDLSASADVGAVGIFGTGLLDGGGTLVAVGSVKARRSWHIGCIRLRPPGYGNVPYGKGPYGGLN